MKKNHNSENEFAKGPYTYEVCPHCGEEVELRNELMVQTCPHCGKRIVTCSMCCACDSGIDFCRHCCLDYQARVENQEKGRLSIDIIADVRTIMRDAGKEEVTFAYEGSRPSFRKDGVTYDLFFVVAEENGDVSLSAVPVSPWLGKVVDFTLDPTWRKASLEKIKGHVEKYLDGNRDL